MENKSSQGLSLRLWCELAVLILLEVAGISGYSYLAKNYTGESAVLIVFLIYQFGIILYLGRWWLAVRRFRKDGGRTANGAVHPDIESHPAVLQPTTIDDHLYWNADPECMYRDILCPVCKENLVQDARPGSTRACGISRCCCHVIHENCARRFFNQVGTLKCPFCRCTEFDREFTQPLMPDRPGDEPCRGYVTMLSNAESKRRYSDIHHCPVCLEHFCQTTKETVVATCCNRYVHKQCSEVYLNSSLRCPECAPAEQNRTRVTVGTITVRIMPRFDESVVSHDPTAFWTSAPPGVGFCPICQQEGTLPTGESSCCQQRMHKDCAEQYFVSINEVRCPLCRESR